MPERDRTFYKKGIVVYGDHCPGQFVEPRDVIKRGTFMTSEPVVRKSAPTVTCNLAEIGARTDALAKRIEEVRQTLRRR